MSCISSNWNKTPIYLYYSHINHTLQSNETVIYQEIEHKQVVTQHLTAGRCSSSHSPASWAPAVWVQQSAPLCWLHDSDSQCTHIYQEMYFFFHLRNSVVGLFPWPVLIVCLVRQLHTKRQSVVLLTVSKLTWSWHIHQLRLKAAAVLLFDCLAFAHQMRGVS